MKGEQHLVTAKIIEEVFNLEGNYLEYLRIKGEFTS